jgi:hypothetical protein
VIHDSAIHDSDMRGERYGDYDRGGSYDRREGREGRDPYDRQDRRDRGGRDRPGYGQEDRDHRGRERAPGDRPGRDYADRPAGGRDFAGRDHEGRPSASRPPASRPSSDRPHEGRSPANSPLGGRDFAGRDHEGRPPAKRPPASRPSASRPPTVRRDAGGRDAGGGDGKSRSTRVRSIAVALAVAATASLAVTGYAVSLAVLNRTHLGRGAHGSAAGSYVITGIASFVSSNAIVDALAGAKPAAPPTPAAPPPVSLTLTARDKRDCPAAATACVDLAEHITWLQSNGKVTYGPVQMEPGPPGSVHATPTGTFNVAWKAGPTYMSTIYHELIPWAVFFAPGGIAFHEGSLTVGSHGCVHLTMDAAHYYNENLPIGAEVVVF